MAKIDDFKVALAGGGARSNHFKVQFTSLPTGVGNISSANHLLITATSLPASDSQPIPVSFRGRQINVAGEQSFQPWNVQVLNDVGFEIRTVMERWMSLIQQYQTTTGAIAPVSYKAGANVTQLGRDDQDLYKYEMVGIFPISISQIALDYSNAAIEAFDITFAIDYFIPVPKKDSKIA